MARDKPRIVCLDLDTFFVSVERLLDPRLEGQAVIVGGKPGTRGVVTACSYEVRRLGVRSGMSLTKAGQLAPNAIYVPVRGETYGPYAEEVRTIASRFCPLVQVASIDELYMDFAGCEAMYRKAGDATDDETIRRVVRELTKTIKDEVGLPSSAGIATSRSMAKVACGLAKPAGVLLVPRGAEAKVLAPLPVRKLPGIGPVAAEKLHDIGVETLGQVAAMPFSKLERVFGAWAEIVKKGAAGEGAGDIGPDRPAFREHDPNGGIVGSISNERTFREDVRNPDVIDGMLCSLCERVCWRARKRGIKARTVTLKLRYSNFHTISRSRTFTPTCSEVDLYPIVMELYEESRDSSRPIRLLGVGLSNLGFFDEQINLFQEDDRLHDTVDKIRQRFGFDAVRRAKGATRTKRRTPTS